MFGARIATVAPGCLGHVETLRRVRAGPFGEEDAVGIDVVEAQPEACLRAVELALAGVARVNVDAAAAERLRHGNPVHVECEDAKPAWAALGGRAVAIGGAVGGVFRPSRVLRW